jgi:hypothetical protein
VIHVQASDVVVVAAKYKLAAEEWPRIVYPEMKQLGSALSTYMRQELKAVKYTGALERSVSSEIDYVGRETKLSVGPAAAHAPYVRLGTPAHWVPIEPLKRWAAYKLGDENAAYAVRLRIAGKVKGRPGGTSIWAKQLYGTMSNPFPIRTMRRGDTKRSIETFGNRVAKRIAEKLTK